MRHEGRSWGPPRGRGPGRHIGFRIFGFLFFLLVISAIVGGLVAWLLSPGRGVFLLVGFLVIVLLAIAVRTAFKRSWSPISELIDATTRLGEGDTSVRMRNSRPGPWSPVSASFNTMAARLESEDEQRRRLLADLGHELRTPLTVIRGEIEAVLDDVHPRESLRTVIDEVELMDRLLGDLRTLALTEAGSLQLVPEDTDLGDLTKDVVHSFTSLLGTQGIEVSLDVNRGATVDIDPHRMHQVIGNVVANAISQMPDGGTLDVLVEGKSIVISDTGPGISEMDLPRIFDRFAKAADSKGSGLGLSIARDLVEAHGGTITAANRPEGGAIFAIRLD